MKTKSILLVPALVLTIISISSCKKENKSVPVRFLLTDRPAGYDSVNVHIVGMKVQINHDNEAWIPISTKDSVYNLLDLQNGITTLIAQDSIPDGVLQQVRFILGGDNTIVVDGSSFPLETPSAETSGLKVKIGKALNETMNTFTLDFDALLSVKELNSGYKLDPVIHLK